MLHSNSNTHSHQELNKGSNRHGDNTVRAQGVSYNPAGVNTNSNSSYNATNNSTSDYDSLTNQTSNLNINDPSSNTANPNTKDNASTIGGMVQPDPHASSYNNNTDPSHNTHNSSSLKMGNVQPPSINDLPGSYPKNTDTSLETSSAGNIGHGSSMNTQSLGSNASQVNPQTGSHTSQYGNTAQDGLSHNTGNIASGAAAGAGAAGVASALGSHGNKPQHDASLGVNSNNNSGTTTGTHSLTNPTHSSNTTTGTGSTLDSHNKLSSTNPSSTYDNKLSGATTGTHTSHNPTHGVGNVAGGAVSGASAAAIASALGSHGNKPPHDASLGVNSSNNSGATTGTHSLTNPAHSSNTTTGTGSTLDNHNKLSSTHDNKLSGATTGTHTSHNPTHGAGRIASGAAAGAGAAGVASALGSHNKPSHGSATTGHNNSSVTDEIYGAEFGKVPIHEETIAGDHKHKSTHPHKTNDPERVGESHLHDQAISRDIRNASPKSGAHSNSNLDHSTGRVGGNRQDDKEVAEGLISEKSHAHLDHTPDKVKENHKLDLGRPLDDKNVYADPNSTSLYNEYTPAAPGEGVKPTNPDINTLGSGNHHNTTGESHLRDSGNNHHGSTTSHRSGSNIAAGATGAALGAGALASAHDNKHGSQMHKSDINNNASNVASGDVGSANMYQRQHEASSLKLGSNDKVSGAPLGDVGSANVHESKHERFSADPSTNTTSGDALGSVGLANVYDDKNTGAISNNTNIQQPSLTGSSLNNSNVPGTADTPASTVKGNNEYSGSTTGNHSSSKATHGAGNIASGAAAGAGAAGIASALGSHGNKPPHDASLGVSNSNNSGATTGAHSLTNPTHGSSTTTGTGSTLDNHNKLSSTHDNKLSGATTGTHTSHNPTHGVGNVAGGAAAGAGAAGVASALGSHGNNKPSHDASLGANTTSASGVTSGAHSSTKPTHGTTTTTGAGSALDSHHNKPTNSTTTGTGTYGNAPIGSTTNTHSSHNPTHGSNQVGSVSHPALDPSHDLDAVDTKPSKMGGYMDKMKGAIHESIGKALSNEEMIEKGTLKKAQGEQKILLSQAENQSKHH